MNESRDDIEEDGGAPEPDRVDTSYSFDRLTEAFERARNARGHERDDVMAGLTPQLREEVLRLLALHEDESGPLVDPEDALPKDLVAGALAELDELPDAIGPYRPVRVLGSGGMGTVYLAEREGADFSQQVAVKVLRADAADRDLMLRFRTERRILAELRHPNIASLLDGGTTESGRPYVAMEYVDGDNIAAHCQTAQLSIRDRLALFVTVCGAVGHAHRSLVVHRDLKPDNILVAKDGTPKLLDFGIAKLLDRDNTDVSLAITHTGMRLLTPEYASPEQIRGEGVTTATDVYALGAILFEMLTGERAQPITSRRAAEMERIVCEQAPPNPSTVVRGTTGMRLSSDLDIIFHKAMHKDPDRRYGSVADLAEDVRRHLDGRPLLARPDTWTYRTRRFVTRYRYAVATAAAFFFVVLAFAITMTVQAGRLASRNERLAKQAKRLETQAERLESQKVEISDERDEAQLQTDIQRDIADFLVTLYEVDEPGDKAADEVLARDLLKKGANKIRNELKSGPLVRAGLMKAMGRAAVALGLHSEGAELLEESRRLFQKHGPDPTTLSEIEVYLAQVQSASGRANDARQRLVMARQLLGKGRHGDSTPTRALYHASLARLEYQSGNSEAAVAAAREVERIEREIHGTDHEHIADALILLGEMLIENAEFEQAGKVVLEARRVRLATIGPDHISNANDFRVLGEYYLAVGNAEAAIQARKDALELDRKVLGNSHPDVATDLWGLSVAYSQFGLMDEALGVMRELLSIDRERWGDEHPYVALDIAEMAGQLKARGDFEAAEEHFEKALTIQRQKLPGDHPSKARTIANMGAMYNDWGKVDQAIPLLVEAYEIRKRLYPPDHPDVLESLNHQGVAYFAQGRPDLAEEVYRKVLDVRRKQFGVHPDVAGNLYGVAIALHRQNKLDEALKCLEESVEILDKTVDPMHRHIARSTALIGMIHAQSERAAEAEKAFDRAYRVRTVAFVPGEWRRTVTACRLAKIRDHLGLPDPGRILRDEIAAIDPSSPGADRALQVLRETVANLQGR